MATAVLPAQDCFVREEHVLSCSRDGGGGRSRCQFLQAGAKSAKVSGYLFPNANASSGYISPRRVQSQVKGNPLALSSLDQKRLLRCKVPDDYQPEVGLRKNVNSDGRIYIKSDSSGNNNNNNNNTSVEGPKKGSMDDRCKGGRSLVMGQVIILKRGQTVKDVKGISLAPPVVGDLGILRSVSQQFGSDGENYVNPAIHVLHSEKWAGPAFVNSPSPNCLPLPKFSLKKPVQVDSSATRDLRRLLGLD